MSIREVRFLKATEVRAVPAESGKPLQIEGYASVFNVNAQLPGFQERIKQGAFTRAVDQKQDVVCLFNHDANIVFGRTTANTLRLSQDDKGLRFICDLPDTQMARDTHTSIARGDINGCSFAFTVPDGGQEWSEGRDEAGSYFVQRDISDVDLYDVSPVTYPCYTGTSVDARCASVPAELRSAVDAKNEALKTAVVVPPTVEHREVVDAIASDINSLEDAICEVSQALAATFPAPEQDEAYTYPSSCYGGKFYKCETYEDFVIACECTTGDYFKIPYVHDESKPDGEQITFGEPIAVEKAWVPRASTLARVAEYRVKFPLPVKREMEDEAADESGDTDGAGAEIDAAFNYEMTGMAYNSADESSNHEDFGMCEDPECCCQNRCYDMAADGIRSEVRGGKVRTKRVAGRDLTAKSFAYVGDPDRTETWKFPIMDASHVRNALSRWGQEKGIPADKKAGVLAKIHAAAKKFGIDVDESKSFEPFTLEERLAMAKHLADTFDPEFTGFRYSGDQPRHGETGQFLSPDGIAEDAHGIKVGDTVSLESQAPIGDKIKVTAVKGNNLTVEHPSGEVKHSNATKVKKHVTVS